MLAMKHPGGRWAARDVAGLLLVLGVGLILGGLPALWVLPMRYIGLVRRDGVEKAGHPAAGFLKSPRETSDRSAVTGLHAARLAGARRCTSGSGGE